MSIERTNPVTGTELARRENQQKAVGEAVIGSQEIHTAVDAGGWVRLYCKHRHIGGYYHHGVVSSAAAMCLLDHPDTLHACLPGDTCHRSDTGLLMVCIAGNGLAESDWIAAGGGSGGLGAAWGAITGTLSDQTDLAEALGDRVAASQIETDPTLASDSDAMVPSTAAVREYVAARAMPPNPTVGQMLYCATAGEWAVLPAPGTVGQILTGNSGLLPQWMLPATAHSGLAASWVDRVGRAGGTASAATIAIVEALVDALVVKPWAGRLLYFLPFLGDQLAAGLVPLVDQLGAGSPVNNGFGSTNYTQARGLICDNSARYLNTRILASNLGASNNGGMGVVLRGTTFDATRPFPCGSYDSAWTQRFAIQLSTVQTSYWGAPANGVVVSSAATNAHYYAQRSAATARALYRDGTSIGTNTTSDTATGATTAEIWVGKARDNTARYWLGDIAAFYLTDGSLSAAEVADLHSFLGAYLLTPTGR